MKLFKGIFIVLVLGLFFIGVKSANIALFNLIGSLSQKNSFIALAEVLTERNNVTLFTIFPAREKVKGLTEIFFEDVGEFVKNSIPNLLSPEGPLSIDDLMPLILNMNEQACQILFKKSQIENLKHQKNIYDVSVVDTIFHDCFLPLIDHASKSVVYISTYGMPTEKAWIFGAPVPPYVPSVYGNFHTDMTFWERAANVFLRLSLIYDHETTVVPVADRVARDFTPGLASVRDVENRIPLILLNSHPAIDYSAPTIPMGKSIAGFHVNLPKPLPTNLEKFISESGDKGFVFVSFGTIVPDENMPLYAKEAFIKAFARLPFRVVWKLKTRPPGLSSNVLVVDFAPQNDLLADKRIKAFITHGGLYSYIESIYHGVPIVGVPVFADQPYNIARAKFFGIGTSLSWDNITADDVVQALDTVINDPSYKKNILERQKLFRDNPIDPKDEAAYWIEYVIRHNGSLHLRLPIDQLNFVQYFLLDVIGSVLGCAVVLLFLMYKLLTCCCGLMRRKPQEITKKKIH